jgi:AraC-like DNA-binding protein
MALRHSFQGLSFGLPRVSLSKRAAGPTLSWSVGGTWVLVIERHDVPASHQSANRTIRPDDINAFRDYLGRSYRSVVDVDCLRANADGDEYRHSRVTFGGCRLEDVMQSGEHRVAVGRVAPVMIWWIVDGRVEATRDDVTHVAGPGDLLLAAPGDSPLLVRLVDARFKVLSIDPAASDVSGLIGQRLEGAGVRFTGNRPISPAMARAWKRTVTFIHETVLDEPEVATPSMLDGVARLLAETTLATFPHRCDSRGHGGELSRPMPRLLRRTVDFIEQNASRDIGVVDVATAVSLTPRRVQHVFKQYLDTTPTAYLRLTRLRRVREELLVADPTTTTVTATAGRWGFGHSGRFAVVYRQTFGESPHETLRR